MVSRQPKKSETSTKERTVAERYRCIPQSAANNLGEMLRDPSKT